MASTLKDKATTAVRGRPKGTGAQRVYEGLRDDILHLRLPSGASIEESMLESQYGVSRTPVREALIRLASDGFISLHPNRGATVTGIDFSDVPQFFEIMDVCQRLILRLAAQRRTSAQIEQLRQLNTDFSTSAADHNLVAMSEINRDFHLATADACGNKYLRALYADLLGVGLRLAHSAFGTAFADSEVDEGYFSTVIDQHNAMIEAIENEDGNAAEKLGRMHTELFRDRILKAIEANSAAEIQLGESSV